MKAAVRRRYGPPDVVRIEEVDAPMVGERDVLVRVHATTVNRTDCGFRSGKPFLVRLFAGVTRPRAKIMGTEFAGVVDAVGARVTSFAVGDRVFGFHEWKFGAHAEYLAIPESDAIAPMPEGFAFEEAAPATEASHYALTNIKAARGGSGQNWLVYGATGAIGSAAVQLLKNLGATVTAVCASPHLELVKDLGADRVVDYTAQDFTQDNQRYDVVFDAVGKSSFGACKRLLKPRGTFLCTDLGPRSQNPFLAVVTALSGGKNVKFPLPRRRDRAAIEHFKELMESGAFRPVIDRRYSLDEIVEAYRYVETEQKIGNVVILV
jgi:NADPH:quinone reductase-like Zn-dependent oxidoreductase